MSSKSSKLPAQSRKFGRNMISSRVAVTATRMVPIIRPTVLSLCVLVCASGFYLNQVPHLLVVMKPIAWSLSAVKTTQLLSALFVFAASYLAGGINSVAGGGSLLTFPVLLAIGIPPVMANATNMLALIPGSVAAAYGYRAQLNEIRELTVALVAPSFIGGLVGAMLLLWGGDRMFVHLSPWLLLGAILLFFLKDYVRQTAQPGVAFTRRKFMAVLAIVFLVSVYGGYFPVGSGIIILAVLSYVGLSDIHRMNGLKNLLIAAYSAIASLLFVRAGQIDWCTATIVAAGMFFGAVSGAKLALNLDEQRVRLLVSLIGICIVVAMLTQYYR